MKRELLPIAGFGLLATVLVVIALVAAPERRELILDLYVLALGGIAVIRLVGLTRERLGAGERSEFDEVLARDDPAPGPIAEREKLEREVELGRQTAFDFHFRLRPTLVEIARNRLAGRGVALDDDARAREILGEDAWELLRPDLEQPRDRNARGITRERLDDVVATLERI